MTVFWERYARARVSRRRALRTGAAAALAVGAVAIVGCDRGGSSDNVADADDTPRRGGTLRFGTTVPVSYGLDPHLEQGGGLPIIARLYGYPFHVDSDNEDALVLDHATSVEQPAPDVYVVRMGAFRFHAESAGGDRRVLSHDMVFSMRRYRDHPLVLNRWWHRRILGAEGGADERTVVIRAQRPYVYSLAELGDINAGAILPQEAVETQLDLRAVDAGSGPMLLREAALPERVLLARNDGYPRDASYVDAMEFRALRSDDEMIASFRAKGLDIVTPRNHRQFEELVDGKAVLRGSQPGSSWTSLGLRVDRPPFSDERVRRALDLAIDRDDLIGQAAAGHAVLAGPVSSRLGEGFWALGGDELAALYETQRPIDDRRREARDLLAAANASDAAFELQVSDDPALTDLASLVEGHLRLVGLKPAVQRLPLVRWFLNYRGGNFSATLISHPPYATPDGSMRLYHSSGATGDGNQFGFADPALDWLIERAWAETAREQRRETVLEAQRLMVAARPLLHLIAANGYTAAHAYVGDNGLDVPASVAPYHYRQWLALPVKGRPE